MSDYIYGIGQELRFNTLGTDLTHTWDFGDSTPISSDPSPVHMYSTPGTYTVIHGARDFCGSCTSVYHTVDIVTASITIRSLLLNTYTAKVGDIVTATVIAQNLSPTFGTGTIVVRFDSVIAGTFNATLDSNQEVSFDISRQVTTAGTINVCADNICTVLFVESNVRVQSITLDTNISTGNPIMATINVQNTGTFTEDKTIQTTLTNSTTIVIDERIVTALPGTITYQIPVTITGLSNGLYTLCAENICKALSVAIPTETTGRLSISSTPTSAEIFVDGPSTSQYTNATVIGITPGDHTFTLKLNGYNDTIGSFTITMGMTTYIYTALSPIAPTTGNINISSTPSGAEIYIDNVQQFDINNNSLLTPTTINDISSTSHDITLKLSDYIDYNKTIDIIAGQTTYLSASLTHEPITIGNINFITIPIGAEIFIDNNPTGQTTPATITDVSIGIHEFILKYPGRNDSTGVIDVIGGMTSYVHVDMSIVPPTIGDLDISSTPSGAEIYLDNNQQFDINNQPLTTPTTITDLSPASYYITLKLPGYIDYNKTMSIVAGQTTYLGASLIHEPITIGNINFITTPSGASIFIDDVEQIGKFTPVTITNIPIGSHTFILKYPGRNDATGSVDVTGGATSYVYTTLSPLAPATGSINISSIPTGAEIYIDNNQQLDINNQPLITPATITGLSPINHNITLKLPDFIDYNKTIDIIAGQTTYLSASLIRSPIIIGNINFITTPAGAEIFIDNVSTGQTTPATIANIPIGLREFILRYPGRNDSTGTIDVIGGMTSYVHVDMSIVPPTVGNLNISSTPTNAEIWIDNNQQFDIYDQPLTTPTTITDLFPTDYNITLKLSGYIDYNQNISIIAGQTTYLGASLIQTPITIGNINFITTPSGASIFIDDIEKIGRLTPTTITDVPIGSHTFKLKYLGRNDVTGSVDVTGGATSYVHIDMTITLPTEGNIAISSAPTNAEIWIDGVRQLDTNSNPLLTPSTITGLTPINHDIKLKLSGYIDYDTTINITAGQTIYLSASLMRAPILIGDINFTTTPDGASIFIDNQEQIGKFTPTTITDLPIGNHFFILKYPGRNDATGIITVIGGVTSYVYVDMSIVSPTKGSISISSIPQDADIYMNNNLYSTKTPTTIDELTPDVYAIILKKNGYNDYTTMINSIAGQTISINITLIPKVTMVVGLEFPWWLVLGIGVGMFQYGKYKEFKDIREMISSRMGKRLDKLDNIKGLTSKGRVVTLTKSDYKIT